MDSTSREFYYFDCNHNLRYINNLEYLKAGGYGTVFKKDDLCYKVINKTSEYLHLENLESIQNLNIPSMYKILEYMYDKEHNKIGYIMPFYEKIKDFDILTMDTEYLTENYRRLYEAMIILGRNSIYAEDFRTLNTICTNNGIYIIDTDLYTKEYPRTIALLRNKQLLTTLFSDYIKDAHNLYHKSDFELRPYLLSSIFCTDPDSVERTFSDYKKPIELFRR